MATHPEDIDCNEEDLVVEGEVACPGTFCDRDRVNNVWLEGADETGQGGVCLLDTMNRAQVVGILKVNETARQDLLRVTSNAELLELAATTPRLSTEVESDKQQSELNRNADSIPFYSIFRGQPPFAQ